MGVGVGGVGGRGKRAETDVLWPVRVCITKLLI